MKYNKKNSLCYCSSGLANFQSVKSLMELNSLLRNFFVTSQSLMRDETEGLANEVYLSNPIASSKQ